MERKKLFNPEGTEDVSQRRLINGNTTNLFNLNNVKYQWANQLYRAMMENFWVPEKVNLLDDVNDYKKLPKAEKEAYDGILSFLVFLDSIQTNNLPNISQYITAPEVGLILAIQTFQEAIHSQSYAYTIESIIDKEARDTIYEKWRDDKVLFERNEYIAKIYQDFIDDPTDKNFFRSLVANFLLESLYFYNGFTFFYLLSFRSTMNGTADIIRYINRDELTHVVLFKNLINDLKKETDLFDEEMIYDMFKTAVKQEIEWTNHIIGNKVLGITEASTEAYTKWLANDRLQMIGLKPLYSEFTENPYKHLEAIADTGGDGNVKANFFESTVTSYNMSSAMDGWDSF